MSPAIPRVPLAPGYTIGARHASHLEHVAQACALTLDADDRAAIAAVQATSFGPQGEVYALERGKGGPHASVMRYTLSSAM